MGSSAHTVEVESQLRLDVVRGYEVREVYEIAVGNDSMGNVGVLGASTGIAIDSPECDLDSVLNEASARQVAGKRPECHFGAFVRVRSAEARADGLSFHVTV